MGLVRNFFTNFSAGQLTERMNARVDLNAYRNGAATLTNFRQLIQGGVKRRPGTRFCHDLTALTTITTEAVRLAAFSYQDDEDYVFCFTAGRCDIFDDTGTLVQSITSMPWTNSVVRKMSIIQAGAIMWVAYGDWQTVTFTRTAVDTFTQSTYDFDENDAGDTKFQPYYDFEPTVTISTTAYTGSGLNITASSGIWTSDHVGSIIRYAGREIEITGFTSATVVVGTIRETLPTAFNLTCTAGDEAEFSVGQVVTGENTGVAQGTGIVVATSSGQVRVQATGDDAIGFEGVDTLIGPTGNIAITADADVGAPQAITLWDEQAFSDARGYPRTVHLHDQRLIFGGTRDLPNVFFATNTGQFTRFDLGAGDDADAIQATIFDRAIVEIVGMASLRALQIFTANAEFFVDTGTKGTLTPAPGQLSFRKQTRYGSARQVQPVEFDGATLFLTRNRNNIREFLFDDIQDAFSAPSVTSLSNDIISIPVDMAVMLEDADIPEQYAFVVNSTGTISVFFSDRDQEIAGWSLWQTNGSFRAVVAVDDRVFTAVRRTINGSTVVYLEQFDETYTLDAAQNDTQGSPTTSWGPYAHLANTEVKFTNQSNLALGTYTLDGTGDATIDHAVTDIQVGLDYTPTLKTLPPEVQLEEGISVGEPRRIVKTVVDVVESVSWQVDGTQFLIRQVTDDLSVDPTPVTSRYEFWHLGWDKFGQITITQEDPLPLTINGILVEVEMS